MVKQDVESKGLFFEEEQNQEKIRYRFDLSRSTEDD